MKELTSAYPVVIEIPIAWGDMDAFQHVNNIMYFKYFESARISYFEKIAALGEGVLVTFDYQNNKKTLVPDEIKKRIIVLEKRVSHDVQD